MNMYKALMFLFISVIMFSISACSATPAARFYTLSPIDVVESNKQKTNQQMSLKKHIVAIGPVSVASYLDRSEIVTRTSPTHLELAGFDRWAEPFEDIVASAIAKNISSLLPSVHSIIDPWPEANIEYQLLLKINTFERDQNGNIVLDASWGLLQQPNREMKVVNESNIVFNGSSENFNDITKNMSLVLVKLSEEIAVELRNIGFE
jgi:uncharacterized lipoprotein YmbA